MADDPKTQDDSKLPKPVTVTGSAFESKDEDKEEEKVEQEVKAEEKTDDKEKENNNSKDEDKTDELPVPVVFGDDDDDNKEEDKVDESKTNDNLVPAGTSTGLPPVAPPEPKPEPEPEPSIPTSSILGEDNKPEPVAETESKDPEIDLAKMDNENKPDESAGDDINIQALNVNSLPSSQPLEDSQTAQTTPEEISTITNSEPLNQNTGFTPPPPLPTDQNSIQNQPPEEGAEPKKSGLGGKAALALVAVLVGASVVAGGYFGYNKIASSGDDGQTPTQAVSEPTGQPTTAPTPETSPTPIPTTEEETEEAIKKSEIKIKVLNGSGTKGAAGTARDLVETGGFEDVATGNADNFEYTQDLINYKEGYEDFIKDLQKALGSDYNLKKNDVIDADNKYDLYIVVGAKASDPEEEVAADTSSATDSEATSSADTE